MKEVDSCKAVHKAIKVRVNPRIHTVAVFGGSSEEVATRSQTLQVSSVPLFPFPSAFLRHLFSALSYLLVFCSLWPRQSSV